MPTLKSKDLITCQEWSLEELETVSDLAKTLKLKLKIGELHEFLKNKTFFMIFYATSTRTRNSFEAGMTQLGGHAHYLDYRTMRVGDPGAIESIKDTVKVLEKYGHGIGVRVYTPTYGEGNKIIREYAKWADIPVINMETNMHHPCQALADLMTIKEKFAKCERKKYVQAWAYSPAAFRVQAVPQENIMLMTRNGMDVVYARPPEFTLDPEVIESAKKNAEDSGGTFSETTDLKEACQDADIIYMRNHTTLNFGEIGREAEQRIMEKYKSWICTEKLMDDLTSKKSIFMHCLPADRRYEVTDEVMDGPHSVIYDQAENRLHVQKAILASTVS
jgi:ornithine carbamoyltransferase